MHLLNAIKQPFMIGLPSSAIHQLITAVTLTLNSSLPDHISEACFGVWLRVLALLTTPPPPPTCCCCLAIIAVGVLVQ